MSIVTQSELERIRAGYDPVPERSYSLDAACYREPRFFELDRRAIFHRSWQFLCHEEKLREPGSYLAADIQGQSVFAARDSKGELRAFYNVCRHRGHEVLKGEGRTKVITCPYHAWAYGLDGRLRTARCADQIENFDTAEFGLMPVRVEVFCSLVFVNLDPDAPPLAEQSGDLAREIMAYAPDIGRLTFAHRLTYRIQANWKAVVDNFLECCHCPVAHKDFCTLVEMDTYKVTTHGLYSSHMAKAGRSDNTAYAIEAASVTDHAVWYLWPNMTLMRYPGRGNFMVWQFIPTGPEETYEVFDFFLESPEPNEAEQEAIRYIDEVLQVEDIGLVESVQRGMRTPAFRQGRYLIDKAGSGMSEHAVHHFHGMVLDAYGKLARIMSANGALAGKTALITGGRGGIGQAICARFAHEGAQVYAGDLAKGDGGLPDGVSFAKLDVTQEDEVRAVLAEVGADIGGLDVLVNAAGIEIEKTIEETSLDDWNRIFAVNVTGTFLVSKHALPLLRAAGGGAIVNFGSYDGFIADPGLAAYCATKGAVHALTRAMACDHGPDNIRVNAICPGYIDTPMLASFFGGGGDREAVMAEARRVHPTGRVGTPEDVASLVTWLASDEARYASGQLWVLDGGLTAQAQQMRL